MPVFVTHADTPVGIDLVTALVADGADVRAFADGTGDVAAVQGAGAIVAVGDHDDEGHLEAAMTHAHTVIVPQVGWLSDPARVAATWPVILQAAVQAEVARIVVVSLVGADAGADHPLLATLGGIEASMVDLAPQTLVVRTDGVVEDGHDDVLAALAATRDADLGGAMMAPVARAALVEGLVGLDAARSGRRGGHATFTALGAPSDVADQVAALRGAGATTSLVGRRWTPPDGRTLLVRTITRRPPPSVEGADLWSLLG